MDQTLARAVMEFKSLRMMNPDPVSVSTRFQQYLISRGITKPKESDLAKAAIAAGISPADVPSFMDEFASWL